MSIANEIQRLQKAKEDIRNSIEAKGVSVPSDTSMSDYSTYIDNIPHEGGGGGQTFEYIKDAEFDEYGRLKRMTFTGNEVPASGYMYSYLEEVILADSVESIGIWAFDYCSSLTSLTIGNGVKTIGNYGIYNCTSLTSLVIPSSVESIGSYGIGYNSGLTSITINAVTPPTLSNVNAFTSTTMCPIYVPEGSVDAYKSASNWSTLNNRIVPIGWEYDYSSGTELRYSGQTEFTHIDVNVITSADTRTNTISNLNNAFIGDNVTEIGERAFSGATRIASINFGNNSKLETIGANAFDSCAFNEFHIPNSVKTIGKSAFSSCRSLKSLVIPNSVTSIGDSTFSNCTGLTSIVIPNSVENIGTYVFNNCYSLKSLTIPNSVTSIGYYAFQNCSGLTEIILTSSTPPTLGSSVFINTNDCPIYVPDESVNAYKTASTYWSTYSTRIKPISERQSY